MSESVAASRRSAAFASCPFVVSFVFALFLLFLLTFFFPPRSKGRHGHIYLKPENKNRSSKTAKLWSAAGLTQLSHCCISSAATFRLRRLRFEWVFCGVKRWESCVNPAALQRLRRSDLAPSSFIYCLAIIAFACAFCSSSLS